MQKGYPFKHKLTHNPGSLLYIFIFRDRSIAIGVPVLAIFFYFFLISGDHHAFCHAELTVMVPIYAFKYFFISLRERLLPNLLPEIRRRRRDELHCPPSLSK